MMAIVSYTVFQRDALVIGRRWPRKFYRHYHHDAKHAMQRREHLANNTGLAIRSHIGIWHVLIRLMMAHYWPPSARDELCRLSLPSLTAAGELLSSNMAPQSL